MLRGSLVAAWRVLRLSMVDTACVCERKPRVCRLMSSDSRQDVVLRLGDKAGAVIFVE